MPAWTMRLEVPQADNAERDTILLLTAAQSALTTFSDKIHEFRRIS